MSRILLLGYTPPIFIPGEKIEAAHFRTWQFLIPLLKDGHFVHLCTDEEISSVPNDAVVPYENLTHSVIPFGSLGWIRAIHRAHNEFQPDCIVAVNFDRCLAATKISTDKPMWMDIYGDYLTIMQAARYHAGSDRGIPTSIAFLRRILRSGDKFSACGSPQQHMITGELAMVGRLNHLTFGYSFVDVILPGAPTSSTEDVSQIAPAGIRHIFSDEDFIVLWCGGYNTWTDVNTLFEGLQIAMSRIPKMHFLSVGESTYDASGNMYEQFIKMIRHSKYRDRFHMLGWRPWQEIPAYYQMSDIGINIDSLHYETVYGTRTRLLEMIKAGLPVLTTGGSEISRLLEACHAAETFQIGSSDELSSRLIELANDPERVESLRQASFRCSQEKFSFDKTVMPLCGWVKHPVHAPDQKDKRGYFHRIKKLEFGARARIRLLLWNLLGLER